ncbi:MAG: signal peptide peptidase SppA [Clostridiales bacterium]|nr:signal peptide peptidase SppA [Clostridiales bacterium]
MEEYNYDYLQEVTDPAAASKRKKKLPGWAVWVLVLVGVLAVSLLFGNLNVQIGGKEDPLFTTEGGDYVGVLYVEGTIQASNADALGNASGYQHWYAMEAIEEMMADETNKGILLYVNTPGGAVYEADELYQKLMEYKETTGRPIYTYMANQATSAGYYISMTSEHVMANRNCWTGSIGVTLNTMFDVSGLLEKFGVTTVTITSGENKSMGSSFEPMTEEQKAILQSLVDDSYSRFVDVVVKGRSMAEERVRELADGRIYTARQALELDLIDQICGWEEAVAVMRQDCGLSEDVEFVDLYYYEEMSLANLFGAISTLVQKAEAPADSDLAALVRLMEQQQTFEVTYCCPVVK